MLEGKKLFIDDLVESLRNPCFAFADDVKVVSSGDRATLVSDINAVLDWSVMWDMPINWDKCHLLTSCTEPLMISHGNCTTELDTVRVARDLGVLISTDFKPAEQCLSAAKTARGVLFRLRATLSCRRPEVFLPLYTALVRPHLEYCVQAWSPYYSKDIDCLERVQKLATRMMVGQSGMTYSDRLRRLGLFSLRRRRARGDLIETFEILKGLTKVDFQNLFELAPSSGTRGHCLKLRKKHSRLNVRMNFFTNRVINMWNKLPAEVVSSLGVTSFKHSLDRCWESLFPELI